LYDIDAETAVLAAMMMDQEAVGVAVQVLKPASFDSIQHRCIYQAMTSLYDAGVEIDPISLSDELKRAKNLDRVGGLQGMYDIAGSVPTARNIRKHAEIVAEHGVARELVEVCRQTSEAVSGGEPVLDALRRQEQKLIVLGEELERGEVIEIGQAVEDCVTELNARAESGGGLLGLSTGYYALDAKTGGLQAPDLLILAARPSVGKTALALNITYRVAGGKNATPVGFFSLEMSAKQLAQRLVAVDSGVDSQLIRMGQLQRGNRTRVRESMARIRRLPIHIDDTAGIDVSELRAKARRMSRRHGIKLIVVDYLQLMKCSGCGYDSRQYEVAAISGALKGIAKELNIPVLALSQLSRAIESRSNPRPMLSDLIDSGAIEQDADIVMFLHRPEMDGIEGYSEVLVEKNRNGPTGEAALYFDKSTTTFKPLER